MTTENNNIRFEEGATYEMHFIGDADLRPHFKCIKRTAKTATFKGFDGEILTRKIRNYSNCESITKGNYSMAPGISADYKIK